MPTDEQIIAEGKAWTKKFLKILGIMIIIYAVLLVLELFFPNPVLSISRTVLGILMLVYAIYFAVKYRSKVRKQSQ